MIMLALCELILHQISGYRKFWGFCFNIISFVLLLYESAELCISIRKKAFVAVNRFSDETGRL